MTESTSAKSFIDKGCYPHQAQFAAAFFAPDAARKQLLVSDPGLGKGFVSATIMTRAMSIGLAHRTLVIAPSALLSQWQESILRHDPAVPVMIVDRRQLRELEDSQTVGHEIWPSQVIAILSHSFVKQSDVAATLSRSRWDLLLVDESQFAQPHTHLANVLGNLLNCNSQMRVLLLRVGEAGPTASDKSTELFRDVEVTVWRREGLSDHEGKPLLPETRMEWITYRRRPEEVEVLSQLENAVRSPNVIKPHLRLGAATLLQSASSSLFALEQRLRRMRQLRNDLLHGVGSELASESDVEDLGVEEPRAGNDAERASASIELSNTFEPLLRLLEELPGDSKNDALLRLLNSLSKGQPPDCRVCIFTRFVDTATYLVSTLEAPFGPVKLLTGGISFPDRERIVAEFVQEGGILISTDAVKATIPEVAVVVFYDLPLKHTALQVRMGQFLRFGRRGSVRIVAFTDESNAMSIERLQRKIAEGKEGLGEDEINQELFSTQKP